MQKFDPDTGKPLCVLDNDGSSSGGGGTDIGFGGSDLGAGSGGSDGGAVDTASSSGTNAAFECPIKAPNPEGLAHGKACTKDSDCMYGICYFGAPATGYDSSVGICTKNCNCTDKLTPCSIDGNDLFTCAFERTANDGNPKRNPDKGVHKMCLRQCKTSDDCVAWNPALPDCINADTPYVKYGVLKYCAKIPK